MFVDLISRKRRPDHFVLILHETPGTRYSLIPGDFLSKGSKKEVIRLGHLTSIGITKKQKYLHVQRDNGACKDYKPHDSQAKCNLKKVLLPRFLNDSGTTGLCLMKNITHRCLIPQAYDILSMSDVEDWPVLFPQCTSEDEYSCMLSLLSTNATLQNLHCPPPCVETAFETAYKSLSHDNPDLALFLMYYQSDRMSLLEEYLIFDFSAILVAIGGSLGLFLGFSFFQCGSMVLDESISLIKRFTSFLTFSRY